MVTSPAWGIPAAPMLAAVAVMLQDRTTRMRTTEEEEAEFTGLESDAVRTKKQFRTRASGTLSG